VMENARANGRKGVGDLYRCRPAIALSLLTLPIVVPTQQTLPGPTRGRVGGLVRISDNWEVPSSSLSGGYRSDFSNFLTKSTSGIPRIAQIWRNSSRSRRRAPDS
jgi:hypothetical protein